MRGLIAAGIFATVAYAAGQAGPTDRQKIDSAAAMRGRIVYAESCINCHGSNVKGDDNGPDLIRSSVVLHDRLGNEIGPAMKKLANHLKGLLESLK